jgi:hypothetical protein
MFNLLKLLYAAANDDAGQLRCRAKAFLGGKEKSFKASTPETTTSYNTRLRHLNPPVIPAL